MRDFYLSLFILESKLLAIEICPWLILFFPLFLKVRLHAIWFVVLRRSFSFCFYWFLVIDFVIDILCDWFFPLFIMWLYWWLFFEVNFVFWFFCNCPIKAIKYSFQFLFIKCLIWLWLLIYCLYSVW